MENASRALTMAGGILIALLIIGALVLMFNQIGDYEKGKSSDEKLSQVVEFNKQFTQYTYDDIKGYELISLINKVIDYNGKNGVGNSVDYNKKITVKVDVTGFNQKFGVDGKTNMFEEHEYVIINSESKFAQIILNASGLEGSEYSEFKISTFRSDEPIYDGEQVVGLSFKFVK